MFTHIDSKNQPGLVDISKKGITLRTARAKTLVRLPPEDLKHFVGNEIQSKKRPVLGTAIVAGTVAVKRTSDWIPFCHPIQIQDCEFNIRLGKDRTLSVEREVTCEYEQAWKWKPCVARVQLL